MSNFTSYRKQWERIAAVVKTILETKILMLKELSIID